MKVDWENNIAQILSSYRLTDQQVEDGISALSLARELYDHDPPDRIMLFDKNNNVVHVILTHGGRPCTTEVRPKSMFSRKIIGSLIVSVIAGAIIIGMIMRK